MKLSSLKKMVRYLLKDKFDIRWIEKLKKGIERDIKNPSPRF